MYYYPREIDKKLFRGCDDITFRGFVEDIPLGRRN